MVAVVMMETRSGDAERARAKLEAALRLQPDFAGAADATRVLAGL
jgi:hypothetical protein